MEPKSPIRSRDLQGQSLSMSLCPVDSEDHFELAYEADEFGLRVPSVQSIDQPIAKPSPTFKP
jgi:hypothetical protein